MTVFEDNVNVALVDHDERLVAVEARIWALTSVVRDLLDFVTIDSGAVRSRLEQMREQVTAEGDVDPLFVGGLTPLQCRRPLRSDRSSR